ncbi:MAG: flagellar biosynthesis protein FliA [Rubrivivax sp.]|nr:flagellar biosynthesis protein FliA [Rubrivivax sp.]
MISLHGVSSELIARNESRLRQQAGGMMRGLPPNVDRADLVQVGLIAVAQAAPGFEWPGDRDRDRDEAREAFVRYARMRVRGAMIDELRRMDHLERSTRRRLKVLEIARERWRGRHGRDPTPGELQRLCGMPVDEIAALDQAGLRVQNAVFHDDPGAAEFATLPERDRQVTDAYLGVGMSPVELAESLRPRPSRVSHAVQGRCAAHRRASGPRRWSPPRRRQGYARGFIRIPKAAPRAAACQASHPSRPQFGAAAGRLRQSRLRPCCCPQPTTCAP